MQNDQHISRTRLSDAKHHAEAALELRGTGYTKAHHALANALQSLGDTTGAELQWKLAEGDDEAAAAAAAAVAATAGGGGDVRSKAIASSSEGALHPRPSFAHAGLAVGDKVEHAGLTLEALSVDVAGGVVGDEGEDGSNGGPLLFSIADFLSEEECKHIMEVAGSRLQASFVVGGGLRESSNTWLPMGTVVGFW